MVTDMRWMFESSKFNGDIFNWDISMVTDMAYMFEACIFNGDISMWSLNHLVIKFDFFYIILIILHKYNYD